jgi:hypothetical protein
MKTCFQIERGFGWPIKVEQSAKGAFRVTYGKQVKANLDYAAAAHELGECIFHALACEGNLDNEAE